jgi:hypothetical protein
MSATALKLEPARALAAAGRTGYKIFATHCAPADILITKP